MLSVIIPVYNVEGYLIDCFNSIYHQCSNNDEIILVDDGSPDNCPQICDSLSEKYNNVITIHQSNGGLSCARNTGIKAAHGDYLVFLDSDDSVTSNAIPVILNAIDNHQSADIIVFPFISQQKDKETQMGYINMHSEDNGNFLELMLAKLHGSELWPAWKQVVRRSFILDNDLFFPINRLHEDVYWSSMIWLKGKIAYCENSWYLYKNFRDGAITSTIKFRNYYDMVCNANELIPIVLNCKIDNNIRSLLLRRISEACFATLRAYFNCDHDERKQMAYLLSNNKKVFSYGESIRHKLFFSILNVFPSISLKLYSYFVTFGEKNRRIK